MLWERFISCVHQCKKCLSQKQHKRVAMCPTWCLLPGTVSAVLYLAKPFECTLPTYVHVNSNSEENSWACKNVCGLHGLRGHFRRSWDVLTVKPVELTEREKTKCCMKEKNIFSAPALRLNRRERVFAPSVNFAFLSQSCVLSISRLKILRLPSIMIIKWGDCSKVPVNLAWMTVCHHLLTFSPPPPPHVSINEYLWLVLSLFWSFFFFFLDLLSVRLPTVWASAPINTSAK